MYELIRTVIIGIDLLTILIILKNCFQYANRMRTKRQWLIPIALIVACLVLNIVRPELHLLCYIIFMPLICVSIYQISIWAAFPLVIFWVILTSNIEMLFGSIILIIGKLEPAMLFDSEIVNLLTVLSNLIFWVIIAIICSRKKMPYQFQVPIGYYIFLAVMTTMNTSVLSYLTDHVLTHDKMYANRSFVLIIGLIGIGMLIELFIMMQAVWSRNWYRQSSLLMKKNLEQQVKHYERLRELDQDTRRFRHDVRNQLIILNVLIRDGKYDQISKHIKEVTQTVEDMRYAISSGNDFLDAILNEEYETAKKYQIDFQYEGNASELNRISSVDICTIFGNLLDNAFEAVQKRPEGERIVKLTIQSHAGGILIHCENSCLEVHSENGVIKTTKEDQKNHGYGIPNIQRASKKYNGVVTPILSGKTFVIEIFLPDQNSEK